MSDTMCYEVTELGRALRLDHTARFVSAADMLGDLSAQDGSASLRRRLRHYTTPSLLVLDEVGYMSYGQGYADLLFQVISQRYQRRSGAALLAGHLPGRVLLEGRPLRCSLLRHASFLEPQR